MFDKFEEQQKREEEELELILKWVEKTKELYNKTRKSNNKTFELCDICEEETEIDENGGNCKGCGKYLLPCSICYTDETNCNNCKYKKEEKFSKILQKIKKLENLQISVDK